MIQYAKADAKDCANLAAISIQVWLDTYALEGVKASFSDYLFSCFLPEHFSAKIADPNIVIITATDGDFLLGYVMLDLKSFHKIPQNGFEIARLYVSQHHKGSGIGKQLLVEMAKFCGTTCWLAAYVGNKAAISFYKHLGFKDIGAAIFILDDEKVENRILAHK